MTTGYRSLFYSLFVLSLIFLFATEAHGKGATASHHQAIAVQPRMILEGMNNQGWLVGHWTDASGETHWFLMNPFMPVFSDVTTHGAKHASGVTGSPSGDLTLATATGG